MIRTGLAMALVLSLPTVAACAKVPEKKATVKEVPLPTEIDEMDSSQLVATDVNHRCRRAPSIATAAKHSETPLIGGGQYGTYDWAAGKTNGGQIWKTRLAYSKSHLSQVQIGPTFTQIGNVGIQRKLAAKVNSVAYVNGDFFHLRGTNLLYSAMVENNEFVYSPSSKTTIVGVVEDAANEHTGVQGASYIKSAHGKIVTQGLNLVYLDANSVGVYNDLKTTTGLPKIEYFVEAVDGIVTKTKVADQFSLPTDANTLVFVGTGTAVSELQKLKKGDSIKFVAPKKAKSAKFVRTSIQSNGTVTFPGGKTLTIRAVNDRTSRIRSGAVLFTSRLFPATSKLSATVVTDLAGVVQSIYPDGKSVNVKSGNYVLQVAAGSVDLLSKTKVGSKLTIKNSYDIKKNLNLFAAFGNRQNLMINSVVIAKCSPGMEDIRPRNAIGWNENGDVWFATTTMGVRNAADVFNRFRLGGSTVHQLTVWLKELGATQAIMLDGGGSTTMYVKQPTDTYKRLDLPESEWVRSVPQGITMIAR